MTRNLGQLWFNFTFPYAAFTLTYPYAAYVTLNSKNVPTLLQRDMRWSINREKAREGVRARDVKQEREREREQMWNKRESRGKREREHLHTLRMLVFNPRVRFRIRWTIKGTD